MAGRRPFDGRTVVALAEQVRVGKAAPIPHVPRELEDVCRRAMNPNPEERYPTADAMAEDLEKLLVGRRAPRSAMPARLTWALGGATAGLLVVVGLFAFRPSPAPPPPPPAPAVDTSAHLREGRRLSLLGRFEEAHAAFERAGADALLAKGETVVTQHFALHADRLQFPETTRALAARLAATQGPAFDRLGSRFFAHVARGQWESARKEAPNDDFLKGAVEFFADGRRMPWRKDPEAELSERDVWRAYATLHELRPVLGARPNLPFPRKTSTHAGLLRLEALIHHARKDDTRALEALSRSLELAPDFLLARLARARLLHETKAPDRAAEELSTARTQAERWGLALGELDTLLR
jgi:hypothetical protein